MKRLSLLLAVFLLAFHVSASPFTYPNNFGRNPPAYRFCPIIPVAFGGILALFYGCTLFDFLKK